jgi:asparagine synthase (glutamine-hydrolysing)
MCGICGKIDFTGTSIEKGLMAKMATTLVHRGPDDQGLYLNQNIALGHRRLSVIDLSPSAHQPMSNEDGTLWIVYNGEIYNFAELREELTAKGHRFRSHSDTEVIIHLYEEEGPECVKRLRGMFAFAIWDDRRKSLFLARDRVGKKPLFYYLDNNCLIFASEIKAILQDTDVNKKPDIIAIHHYLTYQSVPAPFSAFDGIKKLPPSHYLLYKDKKVHLKRYWKLSYAPKYVVKSATRERDVAEELLGKLKEAVRIRLVSDVPLGVFLSGGIDSSAIVALMTAMTDKPVKSFSIGFKSESYDERRYARTVAERFGTEHVEFVVEPEATEVLPKLVWHYNEPFADQSAIPTYYVAKLAREHVTVALTGDGSDEIFAGYERYVANELSRVARRYVPAALVKKVLPLVMKLPQGNDLNSIVWKLKRFLQEYTKTPELSNASWNSHFTHEMKQGLYSSDLWAKVSSIDSFDLMMKAYHDTDAETFLDKTLHADVMTYLPNDLLAKVDVATMAHSLEARSPFLDHELMEYVAKIPSTLKLKRMTTKYILKKALKGILPSEIISRKKKGFVVPIDRWFRDELKEMVYDVLLGQRSIERGYFNKSFIQRILDEHVSGQWNWQYHIYNLLMLELWHRQFIDSR